MIVNFVGVGASRSGSTWLGACLSEHPDICFAKNKEVHFFDDDGRLEQGTEYYHSQFPCDGKIYGEYTPGYFTNHDVAKRIYEYNPKMKIIILLRDPIDRAFSEYQYNKGREYEKLSTFEEALAGPRAHRYLPRGNYSQHIKPFYEIFPKEQIFLRLYEDLQNNPKELIKDLYEFLDVDDTFVPKIVNKPVNASNAGKKLLRLPFFNAFVYFLQVHSKTFPLNILRKILRPTRISKLLVFLREKNIRHSNSGAGIKKPKIDSELRNKLQLKLKKEIEQTESIIGRDLSSWRD